MKDAKYSTTRKTTIKTQIIDSKTDEVLVDMEGRTFEEQNPYIQLSIVSDLMVNVLANRMDELESLNGRERDSGIDSLNNIFNTSKNMLSLLNKTE